MWLVFVAHSILPLDSMGLKRDQVGVTANALSLNNTGFVLRVRIIEDFVFWALLQSNPWVLFYYLPFSIPICSPNLIFI